MEVDLFLSRLKEQSIPNLSKLPIDEDLCKRGLQCAFEKAWKAVFIITSKMSSRANSWKQLPIGLSHLKRNGVCC